MMFAEDIDTLYDEIAKIEEDRAWERLPRTTLRLYDARKAADSIDAGAHLSVAAALVEFVVCTITTVDTRFYNVEAIARKWLGQAREAINDASQHCEVRP